jgi:hypothetical protein
LIAWEAGKKPVAQPTARPHHKFLDPVMALTNQAAMENALIQAMDILLSQGERRAIQADSGETSTPADCSPTMIGYIETAITL